MIIADYRHANSSPPFVISSWISRTSFASVTDGLSNTFLVGEKHVVLNKFGTTAGGDGSIYNGDPGDSNCARVAGPGHLLARTPRDSFNTQFGSYHTGGICQFLMGDGSVRSLSVAVSGDILSRLSVRDDGKPIDDSMF